MKRAIGTKVLLMFRVWSCGSRRVRVSFFRAEKGSSGGGLDAMRTKSSKAKRCPVCGADEAERQDEGGNPTVDVRHVFADRGHAPTGRGTRQAARRASRSACGANDDSRALRKRTAWRRNIRPAIPPCRVKHHTVMADGTYTNHGWCLVIAIDGESGETLGCNGARTSRRPRTWRCSHASPRPTY